MSEPRTARALKPRRSIAGAWRGGRITAVGAETLTMALHAEHAYVEHLTVARVLYPAASVGGAVVCRIANVGAPTAAYIVAEIQSAVFCRGIGETGADDPTAFGHVDYALTGESRWWDGRPDGPRVA